MLRAGSRDAGVPDEPELWTVEGDGEVRVGWGGWGEYVLTPSTVTAVATVPPPFEVAVGLVHSALPIALPFYGLEPLHGAAVETGGRALLVLGDAGAGKSTTALALVRAGCPLLTDDACAFTSDARLVPGPPLRAAVPPPEPGDPTYLGRYEDKHVHAVPPPAAPDYEVAAAVCLAPARGAPLALVPLDAATALRTLLSYVRTPTAFPGLRLRRQHEVVAALASRAYVLTFDHERHAPDDVALTARGAA